MKTLLLFCTITICRGSTLWSVLDPEHNERDLEFSITRLNDGKSVFVKAFFNNSVAVSHTKQVKYFLFSRLNPEGVELQCRDRKTLTLSGFDFNKETKLIIHGFANSASSAFTEHLKNAYLRNYNYNILVVDWSALCRPPFYSSAVDNARRVGTAVAQMLQWLVAGGVVPTRLHMIGHSIGAHIAGIAGHHLREVGQVARITGLDPAKPMFETEPDESKLSSDDAGFVDCIHTCGGFLGQSKPHCSADFYPNDGTNPQPGCTFDFFGICSHQRAYKYFTESVAEPMAFRAVRCSAVDYYSPVNCSSTAEVNMGEHTDNRTRGIFYLATSPEPPYFLKGSSIQGNLLTKFTRYFYSGI